MSRSGYSDDCNDQWGLIRWRGAVNSAIRGRKGQAFLSELLTALDAMPDKRIIQHSFGVEGSFCTLGVIGASRGVQMPVIDPEDYDLDAWEIRRLVTESLHIPDALAAEIMYENDEGERRHDETPEMRWGRMRKWVAERIKEPTP